MTIFTYILNQFKCYNKNYIFISIMFHFLTSKIAVNSMDQKIYYYKKDLTCKLKFIVKLINLIIWIHIKKYPKGYQDLLKMIQ